MTAESHTFTPRSFVKDHKTGLARKFKPQKPEVSEDSANSCQTQAKLDGLYPTKKARLKSTTPEKATHEQGVGRSAVPDPQQSSAAASLPAWQRVAEEQERFDQQRREAMKEWRQMMEDQEALKAGVERLRRQQKAAAETMRRHCKKHGDMGEARERALQQRCRRDALAHVGICSSSHAPQSEEKAAELLKDWKHTFQKVLNDQQRKAIRVEFGNNYVWFLAANLADMDAPAVERFCRYGFTAAE